MTFKRADRPGWHRLRAQRFVCQRIGDTRASGYATLLRMMEVAEPLWVTHHDKQICIADTGYAWLQIFPEGTNYTHTTMFDAEGTPVQEYIDIVAGQGIGNDGVPWYDDLYLDITWIPDGTPILLDQEELEAAFAIDAITQEQYDLARGETARLLVALTLGEYTLPEVARACYPVLRAALDALDVASAAGTPDENAGDVAPTEAPSAPTEAIPEAIPEVTTGTMAIESTEPPADGNAHKEAEEQHEQLGEDEEQHA